MPSLPEHERIQEILKRLDEIQRESELLRARIHGLRAIAPEWPYTGDARLALEDSSSAAHAPARATGEEGREGNGSSQS